MESNMIRGAILAMQVDNDTKTKLFKYLDELEDDSLKLCAFENAGVDNWTNYGEAMELYREYQEEE